MTRWAPGLVAAALSGCVSESPGPVEPREGIPVRSNAEAFDVIGSARDRAEVDAPPIPLDLVRLRFELERLPLASERVAASRETMRVSSDLSETSMVLATGLIAEVQIGVTRLYTQSSANPFGPTIKSSPIRDAFHGICRELGPVPARWRGFRADTVTEDQMDFVDYHGSYDARHCEGVAVTRRTAKAIALIPSVLYAFRTCLDNCEAEPALPRRESVTFIAPPASLFLESGADLSDVTNPHVGTFSVSEIEVEEDAIGTLALNLTRQALERSDTIDQTKLLGVAGVRLDVEVRGGRRSRAGALNVFISGFQSKGATEAEEALSPEALGERVRSSL